MFTSLAVAVLAAAGSIATRASDTVTTVRVRVDSVRNEVIITAGPIHLPAG